MNISDKIRDRVIADGSTYFSTDNISKYIEDGDIEDLIDEVASKFEGVLKSLIINVKWDHNTKDTARRVAKMYVNEVFSGRYRPMPPVTAFPNAQDYDQIYTVGPITVRGTCAHHFQAIVGKCWIGIKPSDQVIGLSKFNRLVDWICSRPSIQEEMTEQIADLIEKITKAEGIIVVLKAEHLCMTHRGVKEHESDMTTSVVRGVFREEPAMKSEFFSMIRNNS